MPTFGAQALRFFWGLLGLGGGGLGDRVLGFCLFCRGPVRFFSAVVDASVCGGRRFSVSVLGMAGGGGFLFLF